jgi:hypothetical protein
MFAKIFIIIFKALNLTLLFLNIRVFTSFLLRTSELNDIFNFDKNIYFWFTDWKNRGSSYIRVIRYFWMTTYKAKL